MLMLFLLIGSSFDHVFCWKCDTLQGHGKQENGICLKDHSFLDRQNYNKCSLGNLLVRPLKTIVAENLLPNQL